MVMAVAERMLAGEIALEAGDLDQAIAILEEAVEHEDAIPYNEPPDWYYPARHSLGVALLMKGDAEAAEAVYRADLEDMPENGWALLGLTQALAAQGRGEEAADVQARFDLAWRHADVEIEASRI
jgi:Tfp pilus assembly protein PilF